MFPPQVMYNLSPDTRTAIRTLNCRDTQGNTIIHLLARKGDSNQQTLRDLLGMQLTDGTKVFSIVSNSKKQFPMHIAVQNVRNQAETIKLLYQAMPRSFEAEDDDGMTALHYACQRTQDVSLVATILSYKKDNINVKNRDGMTALDLVITRTQVKYFENIFEENEEYFYRLICAGDSPDEGDVRYRGRAAGGHRAAAAQQRRQDGAGALRGRGLLLQLLPAAQRGLAHRLSLQLPGGLTLEV